MRLDFISSLDGDGIKTIGRDVLDLCFVVDISGSMNSTFGAFDSNNQMDPLEKQNKLQVAVACLLKIMDQLNQHDRISVVLFNDRQVLSIL